MQVQSRSQVHVRHPARCAETELSNPKWRRANAASTTPAISRFTALFADMAKGLSVILRDIESTKTATEHNTTTNGGI